MDIDTHLLREIEEGFREDLPIGDDDEIVTAKRSNMVQKLFVSSDFLRLEDGDIFFCREDFYWTASQFS